MGRSANFRSPHRHLPSEYGDAENPNDPIDLMLAFITILYEKDLAGKNKALAAMAFIDIRIALIGI